MKNALEINYNKRALRATWPAARSRIYESRIIIINSPLLLFTSKMSNRTVSRPMFPLTRKHSNEAGIYPLKGDKSMSSEWNEIRGIKIP